MKWKGLVLCPSVDTLLPPTGAHFFACGDLVCFAVAQLTRFHQLYSILQGVFSHYASIPLSSLPEPSVLHPEGEISCDELERVERGQPVWDRRRVNEFARKTNGQRT